MKISEIGPVSEKAILTGIEVDEESFSPPQGVETIGLLWQGSEEDLVSELLIDTIISYNLAGVEVVLEIPHDAKVRHEDILKLAGNAGFSVAAIPPPAEDGLQAWYEQCQEFAKALLHVPNFSGHLMPATGYISYLIAEKFAGKTALTPSDPYTRERFFDAIPEEWSDASKDAMREAFRDILGGEEGLTQYLAAILTAMRNETARYLDEKLSSQQAD